ncbi:MAG: hypothetical protein DHS20C15_25020 [Planctomycetota bacterium]|nr:MAG: hypothetical protein DHS20C15_25020 [Planctomycetota bacterium]
MRHSSKTLCSLALGFAWLSACGAQDDDGPARPHADTTRTESVSESREADTPAPEGNEHDAAPRNAGWRLAEEDSPYLRQHADNAVEWYAWGPEAFAEARRRDVPIFLSIGYSSCHWCHVMEHESFEDPAIGAQLAADFVSIKVDREQRPDIDARYMHEVTLISQTGGGWPLTAFLTPEGQTFFGGTYFPPTPRMDLRSFSELLGEITRVWTEKRAELEQDVQSWGPYLSRDKRPAGVSHDADQLLADATLALRDSLDPTLGGRSSRSPDGIPTGPRFPPATALQFLITRQLRGADVPLALLEVSFDAMANRGLFDHVAGGFHRYTVDPQWSLPHFEKMLDDNALLAPLYAEFAVLTGHPRHARVARRTLRWLLDDMRDPVTGLFFTSRDADSLPFAADNTPLPGARPEEGQVSLWTPAQLREVLGERDGSLFAQLAGVTELGNFEAGRSHVIPGRAPEQFAQLDRFEFPEGADPAQWWQRCLDRLLAARSLRPQAFRDEKCLAGWNGLALSAFARSSRWLADEALAAHTEALADALLARLVLRDDAAGARVAHQVFEARASGRGSLFAQSAVALGLLDAHEATGRADFLVTALELARSLTPRFGDPDGGFFASDGHDPLLPERGRSLQDNPRPSGEGLALQLLLRLAPLDDSGALADTAHAALRRCAAQLETSGQLAPSLLLALDAANEDLAEVVLSGGRASDPLRALARATPLPVSLLLPEARTLRDALVPAHFTEVPGLLAGRARDADSAARAWVCRRGACLLPADDVTILAEQLASFGAPARALPLPLDPSGAR